MKYKTLGKTGLNISTLSLGGMSTKGMTQADADHLFNTALDEGINYIDTSPEYIGSEELIGKAICNRRSEYVLATKCGDYLPGNGPNKLSPNIWFTKQVFEDNIYQSLKLLKTDHIDVMQLHGIMPEYFSNGEADELWDVLEGFRQRGIILHIGATLRNGRPGDALFPAGFALQSLRTVHQWKSIEMFQVVYGMMTRTLEQGLSVCRAQNLGLIARGVMKQYLPEYETLYEKADIDMYREPGESRYDLMLRFALSNADLTSVLVGTGNVNHLLENVKTARKGPLSQEVLSLITQKLDAIGVVSAAF